MSIHSIENYRKINDNLSNNISDNNKLIQIYNDLVSTLQSDNDLTYKKISIFLKCYNIVKKNSKFGLIKKNLNNDKYIEYKNNRDLLEFPAEIKEYKNIIQLKNDITKLYQKQITLDIAICSDLHANCNNSNEKYLNEIYTKYLDITGADIIFLCGDIINISTIDKFDKLMSNLQDKYSHIFYVLGNHEYYRCDQENANDKTIPMRQTNTNLVDFINNIYNKYNDAINNLNSSSKNGKIYLINNMNYTQDVNGKIIDSGYKSSKYYTLIVNNIKYTILGNTFFINPAQNQITPLFDNTNLKHDDLKKLYDISITSIETIISKFKTPRNFIIMTHYPPISDTKITPTNQLTSSIGDYYTNVYMNKYMEYDENNPITDQEVDRLKTIYENHSIAWLFGHTHMIYENVNKSKNIRFIQNPIGYEHEKNSTNSFFTPKNKLTFEFKPIFNLKFN